MSLVVTLLMEVCDEMKLPYTQVGDNTALLKIHFERFDHIVLNATLGLNTDAQLKLTQDKFYSYQLLSPIISMPQTRSYIDPNTFDPFRAYIIHPSNEVIASDIEKHFEYPIIIKRNSGTQGKNVFLCRSKAKVLASIKKIYSKRQIEYDHVLLAEDYVASRHEYRVIMLDGKVELMYLKDNSGAKYVGNLSPLHWKEAVARVVEDQKLLQQVQQIVEKIYSVLPIRYAGLDLIEDKQGKLWLLEINSTPQFGEFIKSNDSSYVKAIFRKALSLLADGKQ